MSHVKHEEEMRCDYFAFKQCAHVYRKKKGRFASLSYDGIMYDCAHIYI